MTVLPIRRSVSTVTHNLSREILSRGDLAEVLNGLPYMALIVNADRETLFANRMILDSLGLAGINEALAVRPGELLRCIHSHAHAAGCGEADGCRHCQASHTVAEAISTRSQVVREARILAQHEGRLSAYDFKVTALPLVLAGEELTMVFLEDIGARKRREHLESIFIHDLLNSVGTLQMFGELLQEDAGGVTLQEFGRQIQLLGEEIRSQQLLIEAENGTLVRNMLCVPAGDLLRDALLPVASWAAKRGVTIVPVLPEVPAYLATDPLVARRVLVNALKNAVEASLAGEQVSVTVVESDEQVKVSVWNAQAMSDATRHQVFQRFFSTKGAGRGLGTYSMRLLMENYLNGSVSFTSSETAGTTFELGFPAMRRFLAGIA